MIPREDALSIALEKGFAITNMCGQETQKLMPTSDAATIIKYAAAIEAYVMKREKQKWRQGAGRDIVEQRLGKL